MEKVKEMFKSLKNLFKNLFSSFGITTTIIFLTTVIYASMAINVEIPDEIILSVRRFALLFGLGCFLTETINKKGSKKKIIGAIVSFVIAGTFTFLLNGTGDIFNIDNDLFENYALRFAILYTIFLIVSIIYVNFKKSDISFEEYITKVCENIVKSTTIFIILSIALTLLAMVFAYFVLNMNEYELVIITEIFLMGFYYVPQLLYSLYNIKNETSNFFNFMVKTLLPSLLVVAFAIIYLYIIRILITFDIPSNEIFGVIAGLFVVGLPIWTMANYTKKDTKLSKISENLPFLFIPFIVLQIYAIAVRIIDYGFTEARYLGVMLIIFEIIYITLYFKNKEKIANILIVFLFMSAISLVVPFVNMYKISFYSQYNNLKIYKEKDILTENDMQKIKGAYYYLKQNSDNEELINNYLTEEEIKEITNFGNKQYEEQKNIEGIAVSEDDEVIDVQGYSKMYKDISSEIDYYSNADDLETIFKNITFTNSSQDYEFSYDLRDKVREYISNKENIDEYFNENNRIMLDENRCFVITDFYIRYNIENELILNYSIDGYMLEK